MGVRIGIVGSLQDPECAKLRRVDLLVTAEASPPARWGGSPCVGVPSDGVLAIPLLGSVTVIRSADGEAAGRQAGRSPESVVLVVVPRGQREVERLALAVAKIRASGRTVEIVEITPETCLELRVDDRKIVGLPATGHRGFLPPVLPEAPSAVTNRWAPHPLAPPARENPGIVFRGPEPVAPEPSPEVEPEPSPASESDAVAEADAEEPEAAERPSKPSPKKRKRAPVEPSE